MDRATLKNEINQKFGGKIRVRVGGILIENEQVLLIKHEAIGKAEYLWAPPGGGIDFGQDAPSALKREFLEETGLEIAVGDLLLVNEFIDNPLHAVELFFEVHRVGGELALGSDPEMEKGQILSKLSFFDLNAVKHMHPHHIHTIFHSIKSWKELFNPIRYFNFVNKSIK
jgi:8-oxo-dGTP diphosphatase